MALRLSVDGQGADWVTDPNGAITKANLTFTAKFLWLISAGVPIWNIDQLKTPLGTIDIGLIGDEANELDPHRGPHQEFPPFGDNLADTVAQVRTAMQDASETTDTTPVESISSSSTALSSSRSAPFPALVSLSRVQKLEARMATLLHHIHPWMQRSIAEAEERLEQRMVHHTEWRNVEALSAEPAEDTVLAALFATFEIPPPPPREHAKRRRGREKDEARAQKKERREMEAARRALLSDEEARRMRAVELAAGASRSTNVEIAGGTADSTVDNKDTTEGVQTKR
ncbi:hypothetical protein EJD97_020737 [Solanum chilense]|uniref:Uncharacterized protein n=1 Tax=Solanum chilense TaxID=4083 RepID=A0A6N2C606_SOLCI|nr:hypothetical protein EJD97_020737 [Solanum chilense]